ncbi:hypothetical protein LBMAG56_10710 [Verrucomicrobiota bacterium]|nr:hypothetical protein LBMAG56_10710 [Verrucomicrobiota bacterium]
MPFNPPNEKSQPDSGELPNASSAVRSSSGRNLREAPPSHAMSGCQCEAEKWSDLLPGREIEQEVLDLIDGK